jgi:hypothetical protein
MTASSTAIPGVHTGHEAVTMPRVIYSEWIKFRSLRSTWISFGAALLASIGLGILFSALRAAHFGDDQGFRGGPGSPVPLNGHLAAINFGFDAPQMSLRGLLLAQLAVGVLGVLMITGEYSTGMIRASLTSVPRRVPVLAAKAIVFGVATFVVATGASLVAFLGGQAAMHSHHLGVSLSSPGAARAVLGGGLYLTIVGLLGLGCGFAVRNTGGAIATLFGLILVLPLLAQALPASWQNHVNRYLPLNAGLSMMSTIQQSDSLHPWAGAAVFAVYAVVALVIGLAVLRRWDA